ncbi:MAG: MFS transporter [Paracoccaceae bacterium]|nr:MFS transporter [Paracoccaceae bacterium]
MSLIRLLMLAVAVVGTNTFVLSPIAPDVAVSFGVGPADVLVASSVYGIGTALGALFIAPQADRLGLDRALFLSLVALTLGLMISAGATHVYMLSGAQALAGAAAGVALPAAYGLAAEVAEPGHESETMGKVLAGWTISLVIGVAFSAAFSEFTHWRAVYGVMAVGALVVTLLLMRAEGRRTRTPAPPSSPFRALFLPGLPLLLMFVFVYMTAFFGFYAYVGTHLREAFGFSAAAAGLAPLIYGVGFGSASLIAGIIDRAGPDRVAPFVFAALFCCYLILGTVSDYAVMLLGACFVWGAFNHLGLNILVVKLTSVDPAQRGAIMGLYSALSYLAMFGGTAGFAGVFKEHGLDMVGFATALCIAPALIGSIFGGRAVQSR